MPGRIKQLIDSLVAIRTAETSGAGHFVRAHLILNGIHPDHYSARSADDPEKIRLLEKMIADFRTQGS